MSNGCAKRGWRRPLVLVTEEWDELFFVTDPFGLGRNFFVDYFQHEEGGSKQVWDGSKGMLSLLAVPNCFGSLTLLPISLKPGLSGGSPAYCNIRLARLASC
jgi:hypothetical protein